MSDGLDPVIHAPNRLRICAMLAAVDRAEFSTIRAALDVSDSVLSKQLKILEDAGVVALTKHTHASRVRTWLALTTSGRKAFARHVRELERLMAMARPA